MTFSLLSLHRLVALSELSAGLARLKPAREEFPDAAAGSKALAADSSTCEANPRPCRQTQQEPGRAGRAGESELEGSIGLQLLFTVSIYLLSLR